MVTRKVNLAGWLCICRHTADADVAVVEGVMGLYDSRDGASDDGSTAQVRSATVQCYEEH
jgi:cobyrinic acid a,c-diamide synthase